MFIRAQHNLQKCLAGVASSAGAVGSRGSTGASLVTLANDRGASIATYYEVGVCEDPRGMHLKARVDLVSSA